MRQSIQTAIKPTHVFPKKETMEERLERRLAYVDYTLQSARRSIFSDFQKRDHAANAANTTLRILREHYDPLTPENHSPRINPVEFADSVIARLQKIPLAGNCEEEIGSLVKMVKLQRDYVESRGEKKITNHDQYGRPYVKAWDQRPTYC